jgi:hypothetical protein
MDPNDPLESVELQRKRVPVIFFRTEAGGEPVRDWLKALAPLDRKHIGEDIKTVAFGWPVGMPVCKAMGQGMYEVRTSLVQNRIARVLFYIDKKKGGWFCSTDSSRRLGRPQTKIWSWRGATRTHFRDA